MNEKTRLLVAAVRETLYHYFYTPLKTIASRAINVLAVCVLLAMVSMKTCLQSFEFLIYTMIDWIERDSNRLHDLVLGEKMINDETVSSGDSEDETSSSVRGKTAQNESETSGFEETDQEERESYYEEMYAERILLEQELKDKETEYKLRRKVLIPVDQRLEDHSFRKFVTLKNPIQAFPGAGSLYRRHKQFRISQVKIEARPRVDNALRLRRKERRHMAAQVGLNSTSCTAFNRFCHRFECSELEFMRHELGRETFLKPHGTTSILDDELHNGIWVALTNESESHFPVYAVRSTVDHCGFTSELPLLIELYIEMTVSGRRAKDSLNAILDVTRFLKENKEVNIRESYELGTAPVWGRMGFESSQSTSDPEHSVISLDVELGADGDVSSEEWE